MAENLHKSTKIRVKLDPRLMAEVYSRGSTVHENDFCKSVVHVFGDQLEINRETIFVL